MPFSQETGFFTLTEVRGPLACAAEITASWTPWFRLAVGFLYTWTVMSRSTSRSHDPRGHRSSPGSSPRKEITNTPQQSTAHMRAPEAGSRNSHQAGALGYGTTVAVGSTGHRNPTVQDLREGSPALGSMFSVYWVKIRQDFDNV
ncbi:hypothetical protein GW17_00017765 [Ensete ventricosum]|nr:hypothetical protein GW17_00017765 [Ensete ventricosum]RZR91896.1 hypothetical protein BHM03_00020087 [Ensete ventricosum]